ncbi:MAG: recombinase family protein [Pyrinomonadaceae bacterium]
MSFRQSTASDLFCPITTVFGHALLDFEQSRKIRFNSSQISLGFWTPMQVAIYARVSTHDQQTLPLQLKALREYAKKRRWKIIREVQEVGSGAKTRPKREELLKDARRRQVDAILVWRLDRWGRSVSDLIGTIRELTDTGVGFVSLNEAFDLTTPAGKALSGMLAVFAEFERDILRERVKAGIAHARSEGRNHGRPASASLKFDEIRRLQKKGLNNSEIARQLKIGRTSVIRTLQNS